ncbi:MAG: hypothetical protein ACR2PV_03135, partial [Gammaproteobacteria bacterium]
DGFVTQAFVLSVNNLNDNLTEWSGNLPAGAIVDEVARVSNLDTINAANYQSLATFSATDADGAGIDYMLSGSDQTFFVIGTDGILKLKYDLDAESNNHGILYSVTINARGTAGGDPVGDGAIWISHNFTLSILDVNDPNLNEYLTEWSGNPPSMAVVDEVVGVSNSATLTTANYNSLATFSATDADGAGIDYTLSGSDQTFFAIGTDGILQLKYNLDAESNNHGNLYSVIVSARGTAGGTLAGDGGIWISQAFVLSVGNVNDNKPEWDGDQPAMIAASETAEVDNVRFGLTPNEYVAVATFTPKDADGNQFQYSLAGDYSWMFDIGSDGVLKLKVELDYESTSYDATNLSATVWVIGLSGGAAVGDAVMPISHNFVLSVVDVNEASNDQLTTWAGGLASASINETAYVVNQGELTADNYVAIATLTPTDADGDGFEYTIDESEDQFWLFDIGSDGVLKLKYELDYESTLWSGNVVRATIWGRGTAGNENGQIGAGTTWVSHDFALTILNVDDNSGINEFKTEWFDPQLSSVTIDEDTTITGSISFVGGKAPVAIATLTASDLDGGEFQYDIQYNNAATTLFSIDSNGVLSTSHGFNYEGLILNKVLDHTYSLNIFARGTSDGEPVNDAVSGTIIHNGKDGWITRSFEVSIADVDESSTADGGTSIFVGDTNQDGVYDISFANLNYTNDDGTTQTPLTADNFADSFISFTDADGNQNQHHWYFIADDANDGTGYIVFDVDGDDGTGNDQIHIFGDGNWNWGTPSEGDGI